jgi:large subunit ribosomal protein L22
MAAPITFDERRTNERAGVRAVHRNARMSASKARVVLDLIRNKPVDEAHSILQFCERSAAESVGRVLDSAVANAANNNDIPPEELFVASCFADEGPTLKRWRPRARGRATRINKRTCHITVIVGRYSPDELDRIRAREASSGRAATSAAASRARRVARSRAAQADAEETGADEVEPTVEDLADVEATDATVDEAFAEDTSDDLLDADPVETDEDLADEAATDATVDESDPGDVDDDAADTDTDTETADTGPADSVEPGGDGEAGDETDKEED